MNETSKYLREDGIPKQRWGLVKGRHEMPVEGYIFDSIPDPMDFDAIREQAEEWGSEMWNLVIDGQVASGVRDWPGVDIYVTGLTSALLAVIDQIVVDVLRPSFLHYDNQTNSYKRQPMTETLGLNE